MNIKIDGKDYKVKYTVRALFIFEQITGRNFELRSTLDNYTFFYSMILANNEDFPTWDDFLDAVDNDPGMVKSLLNVIAEYGNNAKMFEQKDDKTGEKKN